MADATKTAKTQNPDTAGGSENQRTRMRSPAYPYINLETALARAKTFHVAEQHNPAPISVAARHWGYEAKSSGAAQTAAALISFGLMQDEGTGEKRKLKLTQMALRILLDERPDSQERLALIKEAALKPKIHQELWKRSGAAPPSHESLKHTLMFEWQPPFNPASVDGFIREYKDTIAFAKLSDSDMLPPETQDDLGTQDGGEESHKGKRGVPPPKHDGRRSNMSEEVFSVPEGKVTMNWPTPLSPGSIEDLVAWLDLIKRKVGRAKIQEQDEKSS